MYLFSERLKRFSNETTVAAVYPNLYHYPQVTAIFIFLVIPRRRHLTRFWRVVHVVGWDEEGGDLGLSFYL